MDWTRRKFVLGLMALPAAAALSGPFGMALASERVKPFSGTIIHSCTPPDGWYCIIAKWDLRTTRNIFVYSAEPYPPPEERIPDNEQGPTVLFDGSSDYLAAPTHDSIFHTRDREGTFSAWFRVKKV